METPIKMDDLEGTPTIFGNTQIGISDEFPQKKLLLPAFSPLSHLATWQVYPRIQAAWEPQLRLRFGSWKSTIIYKVTYTSQLVGLGISEPSTGGTSKLFTIFIMSWLGGAIFWYVGRNYDEHSAP